MHVPNQVKKRLYEKAVSLHGHEITKCASRPSMEECFTVHENQYVFWFNKPDNSTSIVIEHKGNSDE